jgi:hypothetical protein
LREQQSVRVDEQRHVLDQRAVRDHDARSVLGGLAKQALELEGVLEELSLARSGIAHVA